MLDLELIKDVTQVILVGNIIIALRISCRYYISNRGTDRKDCKS